MKVLYFHQHFSTPKGSTGIRSYEMAKKLIASDHQVIMVCGSYRGGDTGLFSSFSKGKRRGFVDGIDVVEFELEYSNTHTFMQRSRLFLSFAFRSIKLVFTEKYDLLFATTTPLTAALPGIFAYWFRRKPFIFEVRDLWPELPREMGVIKNPILLHLMGLLEWVAYKSSTALIGLSPGIKQGISRKGISNDKIAMIPNGCDIDIFDIQGEAWQPDKLKNSDFVALYSGTHGIANGLDTIIPIAHSLKIKKRDDIKLVLIGQGQLKQSLIEKAKELELDNILFLDPVDKVTLAKLMKRVDIGMQLLSNIPAFYYGTSPNKFFDYISAGLPVINNYPGWVADMIIEKKCGLVIPPDDKEAFTNTLIHLADNRELLFDMGIASKKLAREQFDRKKLSSHFVQWLEKWSE